MEESTSSAVTEGEVTAIQFGLASHHEIRRSSISDCPISHASQLANPFLGLPLEIGKCESCGTAELGKCEGHFGYIELPIPVYHPSHISELRRLLSLLCLKCLKLKTSKPVKNSGVMERLLSACCDETCHVSIKESKTNDGAVFLELRLPARYRVLEGSWNFLDRYGYRYGDGCSRPLLPSEVLAILKKLPEETRRKLAKKGYFPQDGYILRYLPVPPNCLSVPDVSDGVSVMSSDLSATMLKKVLKQIEIIRSSRSGDPNFESHEVEANELQIAVAQYLRVRGTGKAARDADNRYGVNKEGTNSSTKAWLEKMRTLFISKGSGFSSRSVITGDAYRPVNEVGLPAEIAMKMTFEERVNMHNIQQLQSLVDNNLCLTFKDGMSTYSLREGSKGHTYLKLGQIVHRRIMDGDIVFINRPPTTHKHSLQALRVYIHDDHTVKINPLMCGPLAADFDGDCVHLFYPQSLAARAEVVELFSVEKQLLSSHSGNLNLQLATDSLLSLKTMFKAYFFDKVSAQQLAMYASTSLPPPALLRACSLGPHWTALQLLQTALPSQFDCHGERLLIRGSEVVKLDFNREVMAAIINEILTSLFFNKSPKDALNLLDSLQPLLMENIFAEGFSVGLDDFFIPICDLQTIRSEIQDISPLLFQLRSSYNELVQSQFETYMRVLKVPIANFILKSSTLGNLIDSRSESAIEKVVQQIGFLGLQLSDKRKFYSKSLVEDVASLFHLKYPSIHAYPSGEFGLIKSCFSHGLDPYEEIVHSIATREVIVRSSKGLAEPGTLFKNLMAILRDVVVCYDGTIRNISSNSIIQFEYGVGGIASQSLFPAGEPVGVLAATAMSNPAYKAVLDSSPSSNSSWDMMKEILFCRVNFKNDLTDRRVILYLNDCDCGRRYCQENASYVVKSHLQKVSLRDAAVEFLIEYKQSKSEPGSAELDAGLVGHIHLNKALVQEANISMLDILQKCEDEVKVLRRKKKYGFYFKSINLSVSECCFFHHSSGKWSNMPCLKFFWPDLTDTHLEKMSHIMADMICPILLDTVIKGDPRISTVSIIWMSPNTTTWVQNPCNDSKGELAVEVTLEKTAVRQSGDAWRIVLDCCLPVFHLIDTRRSIPYAIKQIQDLLGISCTFDQVVQRLSTSVTSVTKGVLKEHLLLLASSMTCAGNLIGFNMSGIKALCRALSVQVPFTEATLYTPRKCFERASEKCHVDSLSSIVASCSWGKRVAVGTGAKFDILWDTKKTGIDETPGDVYSFLQLVRGSNEEEIDTGCLGEDIDRFDWDDAFLEPALSPEQESKAFFEDTVEVGLDTQGQASSSWDVPSSNTETNGWSNWGSRKDKSQQEDSSNASGWSDWTKKKDQSQPEGSPKAGGWSNWGMKKDHSKQEDSPKAGGSSNWGAIIDQTQQEDSPKTGDWGSSKANIAAPSSTWDKQVKETDNGGGGWSQLNVNKDQKQSVEPSTANQWNTSKSTTEKAEGKKQAWGNDGENNSTWGQTSDVSSEKGNEHFGSGSWNSNRKENSQPSWGEKHDSNSVSDSNPGTWGSGNAVSDDKGKQSDWGKPRSSNWKNSRQKEERESGGGAGWGSKQEESKTPSSWAAPNSASTWDNSTQSAGAWDSKMSSQPKSPVGWGADKNEKQGASIWKNSIQREDNESGSKPWGSKKEANNSNTTSWGAPGNSTWRNSTENSGGWGSNKSTKPKSPLGWGSSKGDADDRNEKQGTSSWNNFTQKADGESDSKGWGSKKETSNSSSWGAPRNATWERPSESAGGWGSEKSGEKNEKQGASAWNNSPQAEGSESGSKGWVARKDEEIKSSSSWDKPIDSTWKNSSEGTGPWDSKKSTQASSPVGWGSAAKSDSGNANEKNDAWETQQPAGSQGWGSPKGTSGNENESQSPWGQPGGSGGKRKRPEGGRGWGSSNSGEWKNRKNRPPKQPGAANDNSTGVGFTATRKRLDLFSTEEQDALSEAEAVMQTCRRIMHQSGYNDGDPLPPDDQSYIVNNVLNCHPDKAAKIGAGIDHITVKKHSNFQESRCFYVVSTDGQTVDFSYIKCLENFIKEKYPSVADAFISKYFSRQRTGNRQQE